MFIRLLTFLKCTIMYSNLIIYLILFDIHIEMLGSVCASIEIFVAKETPYITELVIRQMIENAH